MELSFSKIFNLILEKVWIILSATLLTAVVSFLVLTNVLETQYSNTVTIYIQSITLDDNGNQVPTLSDASFLEFSKTCLDETSFRLSLIDFVDNEKKAELVNEKNYSKFTDEIKVNRNGNSLTVIFTSENKDYLISLIGSFMTKTKPYLDAKLNGQITESYAISYNTIIYGGSPYEIKSSESNPLKYSFIITIGVFVLGVAVTIFDYLIKRPVKNEDYSDWLGIKYLGSYNKQNASSAIYNSEKIRIIRTNIEMQFDEKQSRVLLLNAYKNVDKKNCTLLQDLAESFVVLNKRVLVVDCDLRKGEFTKFMQVNCDNNLVDLIENRVEFDDCIVKTSSGFDMIISKGNISLATEYLHESRMENVLENAKKDYDYILLYTSAMSEGVDAQVLSKSVDGVIELATYNKTPIRNLNFINEKFKFAKSNIVGYIINGVYPEGLIKNR